MTNRDNTDSTDYDPSDYPAFAVTVDVVVLTMQHDGLAVLLVQRGEPPFVGMWALPGGFKRPDETLDRAAARELAEETGVEDTPPLTQFGAYGDHDRDPRMNVVSVAYLCPVRQLPQIAPGSDAADAQLFSLSAVLQGEIELAFDHARIIADAAERLAIELEHRDIALRLVPPEFTLRSLQDVYEASWNIMLDAANFRRSLLTNPDLEYVVPTGRRAGAGSRGGRPPELFVAGDAWQHGPPLQRPTPTQP